MRGLELLSLLPLGFGWMLLVWDGSQPFPILLLSLPYATTLIALSRWSAGNGLIYARLGAGVGIAGVIGQLLSYPSVGASVLCLAVGLATFAYGYYVQQRLVLAAGALGALGGLLFQLKFALELYSWSRWGALAVIGLLTVVAAALLERYQERILAWSGGFSRRVSDWHL